MGGGGGGAPIILHDHITKHKFCLENEIDYKYTAV